MIDIKAKRKPIMNKGIPCEAFQYRLARNLKELLKEKNMTVRDLGFRSNVAIGIINDYMEANIASPTTGSVRKLAYALDVSVGELLK